MKRTCEMCMSKPVCASFIENKRAIFRMFNPKQQLCFNIPRAMKMSMFSGRTLDTLISETHSSFAKDLHELIGSECEFFLEVIPQIDSSDC